MRRNIKLHKYSEQGRRLTNEDAECYDVNICLNGDTVDGTKARINLFILCDGHGGSEVSVYACDRLHQIIMKPGLRFPITDATIRKIFNQIQNEIKAHPDKIGTFAGSTVLVAIQYQTNNGAHLQFINLGDCRAVMCHRGLAHNMTRDHKPHIYDEMIRIDTVNQTALTKRRVHMEEGVWRIGNLSVSRAMGDLDCTPHVTHLPETYHHKIVPGNMFFILACDGLWDVVDSQEAVTFVSQNLRKYKPGLFLDESNAYRDLATENIAKALTQYALQRGSTDNITVMIILFKN